MLNDLQLKETLREVGDRKAAMDDQAIVAITDPQGRIPLVTREDVICIADLGGSLKTPVILSAAENPAGLSPDSHESEPPDGFFAGAQNDKQKAHLRRPLRKLVGSEVVVVEGYIANDRISRDFHDTGLRARISAGNAFRNPTLRLKTKSHANSKA